MNKNQIDMSKSVVKQLMRLINLSLLVGGINLMHI